MSVRVQLYELVVFFRGNDLFAYWVGGWYVPDDLAAWEGDKSRVKSPFLDRLSRSLVTMLAELLCSNVMVRLGKMITMYLNMNIFLCHNPRLS
jgi:hypothetical protein